jgi:hypothetical protein
MNVLGKTVLEIQKNRKKGVLREISPFDGGSNPTPGATGQNPAHAFINLFYG